MQSEFVKNVCFHVVKEGTENLKDLCLEWMEIAFNVCLKTMCNRSTPSPLKLLRFITKLLTFGTFQTTDLDMQYKSFTKQPSNLTVDECSDLIQNVYNDFMKTNFNENRSGIELSAISTARGELWLTDFLLYINIFLLISCLVSFYFCKPKRNVSNTSKPNSNVNVNVNNSAANLDKSTHPNETLDEPFSAPMKIPLDEQKQRELQDESMPELPDDSWNESKMRLSIEAEEIQETETQLESTPSEAEGGWGGSIDSDALPDKTTSSSSTSSVTKKPSKDFVSMNKKNIKSGTKRYETGRSPSRTLSQSAPVDKRSSIPVRSSVSNLKRKFDDFTQHRIQ